MVDALVGDTEENAGDESSTAEKERDDLKEKVAKLQRETSELEALLEQEKGKRQEADKERDQLKAVVQQLMHASKSATSPKKGLLESLSLSVNRLSNHSNRTENVCVYECSTNKEEA